MLFLENMFSLNFAEYIELEFNNSQYFIKVKQKLKS